MENQDNGKKGNFTFNVSVLVVLCLQPYHQKTLNRNISQNLFLSFLWSLNMWVKCLMNWISVLKCNPNSSS